MTPASALLAGPSSGTEPAAGCDARPVYHGQPGRSRITDVNAGHLSLISAPGAVARVIAEAAGCHAARELVPAS